MEQSEGSGDTSFMISEVDSGNLDAANMSTDTQRCEFCNCTRTPLWRRGPQGARTLCNACGIRWSNNKAKETGGKPEYYAEDAINYPQQGEEMYQLDCRTGEAVAVVSSTHGSLEPAWCNVDASTSLIQGRDLEPEKSAVILASKGFYANEEEEHETHDSANEAWEEESGISAMEDSPRLSAEEGEDEDLHGSIKIEAGKENYYCKYCDTSWPFNHFRNAQQFGAHCSNCSRKRKVKDPQELTIRERNKRMRKVKKPSHSEKRKQHTRASMERDDARHLSTGCSDEGDGGDSLSSNNGSSEEDFEASGISFLHQAAVASAERERPTSSSSSSRSHRSRRSRKGKRKLDELASQVQDDAGSDPFAIPFVRSSSRVSRSLASQGATKKPKREVASKKKHSPSKSKMVLVTPEEELEHAAVVSDPNSLGGLLAAIERKLTSEKKKKDAAALKQRVWGMRKEVGEQFNSSVEDLRFRSVALVQDLRLDMVAKLEGLKLDLASELSFRETRRKKRLNEMRIQMNALNRILENGKKERENGLLVSTFGGKFDVALKQLEELKANLQKEFSSREQAMQQQFTEMRATCSLHLANIKQQMHEELNVRENRMQKELEEMKHKLHSVCSQIGAENYDADTPIPLSATSSVLASLPGPEKYTTTTTTTTTTTITTNINAPALLPASLGLGVSLPSLVELTASMAVGAGVPPLSKGVASSTNPLTLNGPAPTKQPPLLPSSPNGAGALAFGCLAEIKSATS